MEFSYLHVLNERGCAKAKDFVNRPNLSLSLKVDWAVLSLCRKCSKKYNVRSIFINYVYMMVVIFKFHFKTFQRSSSSKFQLFAIFSNNKITN